ncbi:MAG: DUF975 family protein [Lactobacillales bacterium]|jgi:uncharacterized membrane protein|nr:DUF975 family protein [Lactobacillales bacterium]
MKANYLLKKEAKAILSGNRLAFAMLSFVPFLYNGGNFFSWWSNKLYNRQTFFHQIDDFKVTFSTSNFNFFYFTDMYYSKLFFHICAVILFLFFLTWIRWLALGLIRKEIPYVQGYLARFSPLNKPFVFLGALIFQGIYLFFWTLLFFIPGCVKYYSYAMTYFILKEEGITVDEAITRSRKLMHGHKLRLLLLDVSFLPWYILTVITFGLASFWTMPYILATKAAFYENLTMKKGG